MKPWLIVVILIAVVVVGYLVIRNRTPEVTVTAPPPPAPAEAPAAPVADPQKAFLEQNIKEAGWMQTADGLQYKPEKTVDASVPKPAPGSEVTVNYEGKLIDGTVFDSSYARNEPATFPLSGVIKGWQEGVPMMRVGEIWDFAIPSDLGYGDRGTPGGPIPPGATLLFKIELLKAPTPATP